jgi:uncharacterized phiE125 gp8 family phage protein
MAIRLQPKMPAEVRTYPHDWTPFLGTDTIASTAEAVSGVTLDSVDLGGDARSVSFTVSGGTPGIASITQTITSVGGKVETETFLLQIETIEEPVSLADAKEYLRVRHNDEDAKIEQMIPRARKWVEDHTGLSLIPQTFVERHTPEWGAIRLFKGPLVTVDEVAYDDAGTPATYVPRYWAGQSTIFPATDGTWPSLADNEKFTVTYTAGFGVGEVDERLIGAMLALIEGEYAEGYAYPERATQAAERCCGYLRTMAL